MHSGDPTGVNGDPTYILIFWSLCKIMTCPTLFQVSDGMAFAAIMEGAVSQLFDEIMSLNFSLGRIPEVVDNADFIDKDWTKLVGEACQCSMASLSLHLSTVPIGILWPLWLQILSYIGEELQSQSNDARNFSALCLAFGIPSSLCPSPELLDISSLQ